MEKLKISTHSFKFILTQKKKCQQHIVILKQPSVFHLRNGDFTWIKFFLNKGVEGILEKQENPVEVHVSPKYCPRYSW